MNNILDLSELENMLSEEREVLSRQLFFFKKGTTVKEVKDWIQRSRDREKEIYINTVHEGVQNG